MSVEGQELSPRVDSMKYFRICEAYELETSWQLVDAHHHTCAKFVVPSPTLSQISQKSQRTMNKICRFLNIFYTKIVIAPVLNDTLNLLKESLISTYLTSTSLLLIKRHDQFFVLNRIWTERKVHILQNLASTTHMTKGLKLQKMKTDFKKKKVHKCHPLPTLQVVILSLKNWGFSILLQPRKIKSLVLHLGQPSRSPSRLLIPMYFRRKTKFKDTEIFIFYCESLTTEIKLIICTNIRL